MYSAGLHSFCSSSYATGIAINFKKNPWGTNLNLQTHLWKEGSCHQREKRLPWGTRVTLGLLVHLHPFLQPLSVNLPLLTLLKDPHFYHPAVFNAKCNQKRWCRSCRVVHCPPEVSSACLQLWFLLQKTLFTRSKSRPIVHLWAS